MNIALFFRSQSVMSVIVMSVIFGCIAVSMAIFGQILDTFFGYKGCLLCSLERVILLCVGIMMVYRASSWVTLGAWVSGVFITLYHIAVQKHWLPLASFCKAYVPEGSTLEVQMQDFLSKPGISFDQITLQIFGISAVWFLYGFFLTGCLFWMWHRRFL